MTQIIDQFENDSFTLNVYGTYDEPLFKAMEVATLLEYNNIRMTIKRLPFEFKKKVSVPYCHSLLPQQNRQINFITEAGLYYLAMRSNLPIAQKFQIWIASEVLPSIRKKGYYSIEQKQIIHKTNFKIETEYDLHTKVIDFMRTKYAHALYSVSLGELQDTTIKRIKSFKMGYTKGECDITINNLHKKFNGFVIECKAPNGNGTINKYQSNRLKEYRQNNYKTLLSNDYDNIIFNIIEYMRETRIKCDHCRGRFKNKHTLKNHLKYFHKIK